MERKPYTDDQQVALEYLVEDLSDATGFEWSLEWATDGSLCILRSERSHERVRHPAVIERAIRKRLAR